MTLSLQLAEVLWVLFVTLQLSREQQAATIPPSKAIDSSLVGTSEELKFKCLAICTTVIRVLATTYRRISSVEFGSGAAFTITRQAQAVASGHCKRAEQSQCFRQDPISYLT